MLMDLGRCSPNPDSSPHTDMTAPPKQPPSEVSTLRCLPGLVASWVLMQMTVPELERTLTALPPRCSCIRCMRKCGLPCQPALMQETELSVHSMAEEMGEKGPLAAGCIGADTRAPLCARLRKVTLTAKLISPAESHHHLLSALVTSNLAF